MNINLIDIKGLNLEKIIIAVWVRVPAKEEGDFEVDKLEGIVNAISRLQNEGEELFIRNISKRDVNLVFVMKEGSLCIDNYWFNLTTGLNLREILSNLE